MCVVIFINKNDYKKKPTWELLAENRMYIDTPTSENEAHLRVLVYTLHTQKAQNQIREFILIVLF